MAISAPNTAFLKLDMIGSFKLKLKYLTSIPNIACWMPNNTEIGRFDIPDDSTRNGEGSLGNVVCVRQGNRAANLPVVD